MPEAAPEYYSLRDARRARDPVDSSNVLAPLRNSEPSSESVRVSE